MAPQHSPFFQAQIASRYHHSHSNSVTMSFLSYYDSNPATDSPGASSSAAVAPAAGSISVQPSSLHRRTSSATVDNRPPSIKKTKQHRRNSAISKRSSSLLTAQPAAPSCELPRIPQDVRPSTAPASVSAHEQVPTLSLPPEGAKKLRRSGARYHVTNPSTTPGASSSSTTRRRAQVQSFVPPPTPPPPYTLLPSRSTRRVPVPTVNEPVPPLPSTPFIQDVYTDSPVAQSSMFTFTQTGEISPLSVTRPVRPLPATPAPRRTTTLELRRLELDLDLDFGLDDLERRPSLPVSESGESTTSTMTTTSSSTESIHPFDSDEDDEAHDQVDTAAIASPSQDSPPASDSLDLHSFLEFTSSSSSSERTLQLPRKFRPASIPVVGSFDPTSPEYSRAAFSAGLFKKQCRRIVANGKSKLGAVGRKRSESVESIESPVSASARRDEDDDLDWGDALEGRLFG